MPQFSTNNTFNASTVLLHSNLSSDPCQLLLLLRSLSQLGTIFLLPYILQSTSSTAIPLQPLVQKSHFFRSHIIENDHLLGLIAEQVSFGTLSVSETPNYDKRHILL